MCFKSPLPEAKKHHNFQVTSCHQNVSTNADFAYIENKCQLFAKIQIFLEIFNVKSDWTKPLRGSVAFDLFLMRKL